MFSEQGPLSLATVVSASASQVHSRVGDDLVILELDSSMYYWLDPVGARVFELIQEPTSLGSVVDKIVAEFEVDAPTARTDVLALVDTLVAQKLVEAPATGAS
jgi:Coenzyme PQQ synthesis protein D (PqqD)